MSEMQARARPLLPVVGWMAGALASFIVSALAVRALSRHADAFQIGLARTAVGLIVLLASLVIWPELRSRVKVASPVLHVLRNGIHATGGVLWTVAIATLPFATVFSLEFTAPAWVALLAYPLLGERVRPRAAVGIAVSMAGVLVILRPGTAAWDPHLLAALAAALCFAVSVIITRKLALGQSTVSILLWMMALQSVFYGLAVAVIEPSPLPALGGDGWLAVPVLGLAGLASQLCLARALACGEAATVMPLDFLRVPLIALVGSAFYGEALEVWVLAGAVLIITGVCYGLTSRPAAVRRPVSLRPTARAAHDGVQELQAPVPSPTL